MTIHFMAFTHEDKTHFEPFFKTPSLEALHSGLTSTEFERFLGYMFFCAGFEVEHVASVHVPYGPGVDLNLYANPDAAAPFARVEARRYKPEGQGISANDVFRFAGVVISAGQEPGYMITTARFTPNAQHIIKRPGLKDVHLIDGSDLLRYIVYLYGSRVSDGRGFHRTTLPVVPNWLFNGMASESRNRSQIVTVANNKGGVGKSTTALNVSFALSALGKRVLLIDLDGQANLTSTLPPPPPAGSKRAADASQPAHQRFITEYFATHPAPLHSLVSRTRFEHVWLIPGHEELNRMDPGGAGRPEQELAFARAVRDPNLLIPAIAGADPAESRSAFDWIVIDTPPAQAHVARLALAAADFVLVPLKADSFTVAGINRAIATAKTMQALTSAPQARGLVLTQWRSSAQSMKEIAGKLQFEAPLLGYPLFDAVVPYDDHIEQAHMSLIGGGAQTLFGWKRTGAARAYKKVTNELLQKVG